MLHQIHVLELPRGAEVRHEVGEGDRGEGGAAEADDAPALLHPGQPKVLRQHVGHGVHQIDRTGLHPRYRLDGVDPLLQLLLVLLEPQALRDDELEPVDLLLVLRDLVLQAHGLRLEEPPDAAREDDEGPEQDAEQDAEVEGGDLEREPLLLPRWREVDLDHAGLSPGRRMPSPTATASAGPIRSSSVAGKRPASTCRAWKGLASSTGMPHDDERNSSRPASCAQPPESTILAIRSDSVVDAK